MAVCVCPEAGKAGLASCCKGAMKVGENWTSCCCASVDALSEESRRLCPPGWLVGVNGTKPVNCACPPFKFPGVLLKTE